MAGFVSLTFLLFFPGKTESGETFGIVIIYMYARYSALYAALILIAVRFLLFKKLTGYFMYIFASVLNIFIVGVAVYLFVFHQYSIQWLHLCLVNCLIGFAMFADAYFFGR